jgi:hypothetical protein
MLMVVVSLVLIHKLHLADLPLFSAGVSQPDNMILGSHTAMSVYCNPLPTSHCLRSVRYECLCRLPSTIIVSLSECKRKPLQPATCRFVAGDCIAAASARAPAWAP